MSPDETRTQATAMLAQLAALNPRATSNQQRRHLKEAKQYLERAQSDGSQSALQLGSYHLALVHTSVEEVEEGKRKGEERAQRRAARLAKDEG